MRPEAYSETGLFTQWTQLNEFVLKSKKRVHISVRCLDSYVENVSSSLMVRLWSYCTPII